MATLAELQAELVAYKAARDAILTGAQSYTIAGRSLTRADLKFVQEHIDGLSVRIDRKSNGVKTAPVFLIQR
jgi:hypothetical protein